MKKNLLIAVMMTIVTTLLLGIIYPLVVTGIAQVIFPRKANGQLISQNGKLIGSSIIGQPFVGPGYFHSRPSAAGTGYDATASGGTVVFAGRRDPRGPFYRGVGEREIRTTRS